MNPSNAETLAKAAKELMLKEPFYGLLLMSLNKVWSTKMVDSGGNPTAGVGLNRINYELYIHPEFWEKLSPIQRVGILKHELLHIAFFHITEYDSFEDKKVLNQAMDIEINQYIERDWLPEYGCFLEKYPQLQMEERRGTRYYYAKLKEDEENNLNKSKSGGAGGSGEDGEEDDDNGGMIQMGDGSLMRMPEHDWSEFNKLDEATKKLIEQQTKHIIQQVADQVTKSRGVIPGEFEELLKRLSHIEPPKFDWKGYIRRFNGNSTKTYTKKSRRKYNKRLPEFPGLKIKQQKHILAAIDTSGSVSTNELKEFLAELWHLKKTGSEVTIIQCDTAISYIGKFDPRKDLTIHGRGGTDFQPVIDYYNEHIKEFSCLMYFTDGEAPSPQNAHGNILWVISSQSAMNDKLPGHTIHLPK